MTNQALDAVVLFEIVEDYLIQFTDIDNVNRITAIFSVPINTVARVIYDPVVAAAANSKLIIQFKDEHSEEVSLLYTNNEEQAWLDYQSIVNLMIQNKGI